LRFTTDVKEAAAHAEVHFLAVGTPCGPDGAYDLAQLKAAITDLAPHLDRECLIVGKSTVSPGTAEILEDLARSLAPPGASVHVVWNPEFLREGHAVADTLHPARIVIGTDDPSAAQTLREVYAPILAESHCPVLVTDRPTAEMVKATANAYLATRISFINAAAQMSAAVGADITALAQAIGLDPRIGAPYLHPGLGFGGGCLPKDLHAFTHQAHTGGITAAAALLQTVENINTGIRSRTVHRAAALLGGQVRGRRIGIWGVAFKAGTDDVRDSPGLDIASKLHTDGSHVLVFDPQAIAQARLVRPELTYVTTAADAAQDADLILVGAAWPDLAALDPTAVAARTATRTVLDIPAVLHRDGWHEHGWIVEGLDRR
jgi:UDPglucose 6-dehydrogenase